MRITVILIAVVALAGCGVIVPIKKSESKLTTISVGQQRDVVLKSMGLPDVVRGSIARSDGSVLQVDEYWLFQKSAPVRNALIGPLILTLSWWLPFRGDNQYWLQYLDGKLVAWGKAGDWKPDLNADITIRNKKE